MFKRLESMNLKKKLNFGYGTVIVMMVLCAVFGMLGLWILYANTSAYIDGSQKADTAVKMCRIDVNIAARNVREMVLNDDKSSYGTYKALVDEKMDEVGEQLAILKSTEIIDQELYARYEEAMNHWGKIGYSIIAEVEAGDLETAEKKILEECVPALQEVVEIAKEIDVITDEEKLHAINISKYSAIIASVVMILFVAIALGLAKTISNKIVNSIVMPLQEIEGAAEELSKGNLHSKLEYSSTDEIGNLAESLRKSINTLSSYVDDIGRAMQEFSSGNFDVEPQVEWKGDFVGILDSFMNFEKSMADTVRGIQSVADQVKNGAEQVAASSNDLAEGATEQAGVTEELTATIENVAIQVARNAESAIEISAKVEASGAEIINSNKKMQDMVASMNEISESSAEISRIIATINDIAAQTNLLALNASIEAARAGEAGKGFAVVADQVSLLAAQSADAAKESTALIETSLKAVEKGMQVADETAKHLEEIVKNSKAVTENVNEVAEALEEQTEAMSQINQGVEQINDVVQTNSATSEECAAASQEMSGQAASLEALIRSFKIKK